MKLWTFEKPNWRTFQFLKDTVVSCCKYFVNQRTFLPLNQEQWMIIAPEKGTIIMTSGFYTFSYHGIHKSNENTSTNIHIVVRMEWLLIRRETKPNPTRSTGPAAMQPQLCSLMEPCRGRCFGRDLMEAKLWAHAPVLQPSESVFWAGLFFWSKYLLKKVFGAVGMGPLFEIGSNEMPVR